MNKIRKPRRLYKENIYADFDEDEECLVYVGGRYYDGNAQIHLNEEEVLLLSNYLQKVANYLKHKKGKKT